MRYKLLGPCHGIVSACSAGADAIGAAKLMIQSGLRRRGRHRRLGGGAHAAVDRRVRRARRAVGRGHLAPVRRGPRRLRHGRGRRHPGARGRARRPRARGAKILGTLERLRRLVGRVPPDRARTRRAAGASRAMARRSRTRASRPRTSSTSTRTAPRRRSTTRAETAALKAALGDHAYTIPVSSLKSSIGHLLGAAGAVEAVATILALRDRIAPPTLGLREPRARASTSTTSPVPPSR